MHIRIPRDTWEAIGIEKLKPWGISEPNWRASQRREIDLALLNKKSFEALYKFLEPHTKLRGIQTCLWDMRIWRKAQENPDQWARDARQMSALMKAYLTKVPGHRLFREEQGTWYCYYVNSIIYIEKISTREGVTPARCQVNLAFNELGGQDWEEITAWEVECKGKTPGKLLAERGYFIETPELREQYLAEKAKFDELMPQLGLQLETWGSGTDDLDGNKDSDDERWYWRTTHSYVLGSPEEPGRGVIDVFAETDQVKRRNRRERNQIDPTFWPRKSVVVQEDEDDVDIEEDDDKEPVSEDLVKIEVPIHPTLAIFDLSRHLRLRLHVSNCRVHVYNTELSKDLVLPKEQKELVSLLIEHKEGGFKDIIKGKAGGAVVMLAGPPGTGKTLTAEVYAEAESKALYSVQCSQLGTKPDDLEDSLLKCFTRCQRWGAVMLLDEADVYVHRRGNDLTQNAIVGVFLRVLEYQSAVLFLTTNRPEDVDDAIASRCIARLVYSVPSPEDQALIWHILSRTAGAVMSNKTIEQVVTANPKLSGRDVKNLLKLAMLTTKGAPITTKVIEFVKQFKPTQEVDR